MFADDTMVFVSGRDVPGMLSDVNHDLQNIYAWLSDDSMALNVEKSSSSCGAVSLQKVGDHNGVFLFILCVSDQCAYVLRSALPNHCRRFLAQENFFLPRKV
ncbi:hypothetical protein WA026_017816 [Henosepilachna vigintioctopunctata]|uniref:Reverse transcriptase domain-containing protein n=1 Tax=Henosepilachna vigintioctopunctata TaxID=420089 RepID=A0AAW1TNL3_9CUCU